MGHLICPIAQEEFDTFFKLEVPKMLFWQVDINHVAFVDN